MGRSKIEIKKIENKDSIYSTFTKRWNGLFRKAKKLATLSGANITAIVFWAEGKLYAYRQLSVKSMVDRFLGEQVPLHGDSSGDTDPSVNSETVHGGSGDFLGAKFSKSKNYTTMLI
ncbi:hypothetical protein SLA2020_421500 [Shorea laevis]